MLVSASKKTEPENCIVATQKCIFQLRGDHEWNQILKYFLASFPFLLRGDEFTILSS
jgi:hypothetical protein